MRPEASVNLYIMACLLAVDLGSASALAAPGVGEISQAAVEAGLPPCDATPGFPCEITVPGVFRLTSNLTIPDADTTALLISADDVTLDLNGFTISGPNVCTWSTDTSEVTCTTVEGGVGVSADLRSRTTVLNGHVVGTGGSALRLGSFARVLDIDVAHAGYIGISAQGYAEVEGCTVELCHWTGIFAGSLSSIRRTTIRHAREGIFCSGCTILENTARSTESYGVVAHSGSIVRSNSVSDNRASGIRAGSGAVLVVDNVAIESSGWGLSCASAVLAYRRNVLQGNTYGSVTCASAVQLALNLCDNDTSCP